MFNSLKLIRTRLLFIGLFFLYNVSYCLANQEIVLFSGTIKVRAGAEENKYFGFAEGDQFVFEFEEIKGKSLKEIDIIQMPGVQLFSDFKTSKSTATLSIRETGVYRFALKNTSMGGRICRISIKRTPGNAGSDFNSIPKARTLHDTTYQVIQEDYLISSDTNIVDVTDATIQVHSALNGSGNKEAYGFTLPKNTWKWSYYIGVNQEGKEAFDKAATEFSKSSNNALAALPNYGIMTAIAFNSLDLISKLSDGEDISYHLVSGDNKNKWEQDLPFRYYKTGQVINDYAAMEDMPEGYYHFCLKNPNAITAVNVFLKVQAITITEEWGKRPVEKMNIETRTGLYLESAPNKIYYMPTSSTFADELIRIGEALESE